jgi:hypothetical protein
LSNYKFYIAFLISAVFFSCKKDEVVFNGNHTLPVWEINIDEKYLWSPDSGLYVVGRNGIEGWQDIVANYNQDWEFPANIKFYVDGNLQFDHQVGFRIKGFGSRAMPMKSLGFYWRSEYGNSSLNYQMFEDAPIAKYNRLTLRNAGQDFGLTQMKDGTIADVFKYKANVEFLEYRPSVVYLNGEYWGIQNIRDMITPWHFQNHYGVNRNTVDFIGGSELDPEEDDGSKVDWMNDIIAFLQSNDVSIPANYNTMLERIDIESFMDYIIIQTYIGKLDWPAWNAKWWRSNSDPNHSKWRWVVYDLDLSLLKLYQNKVWIGDLYKNHERDDRQDGFFVFNHLIKNEAFVDAFLERYLYFIDEVFYPERFNEIVLANKTKIESEYPQHAKKWHTRSVGEWNEEVDRMMEYNNKRNAFMRDIIVSLQE